MRDSVIFVKLAALSLVALAFSSYLVVILYGINLFNLADYSAGYTIVFLLIVFIIFMVLGYFLLSKINCIRLFFSIVISMVVFVILLVTITKPIFLFYTDVFLGGVAYQGETKAKPSETV